MNVFVNAPISERSSAIEQVELEGRRGFSDMEEDDLRRFVPIDGLEVPAGSYEGGEGRRPRLGWCWAGNPHTWLGSASCASRVAA